MVSMRDDTVKVDEFRRSEGVSFDPEEVVLEGVYRDELSAYRARRVWREALESNFLLEVKHDFNLSVDFEEEAGQFKLRCDFGTACGRYAFWRLTHNQAPETQYLIETAHIPLCESRQQELVSAADLTAERYLPSVMKGYPRGASSWSLHRLTHWVRSIFS